MVLGIGYILATILLIIDLFLSSHGGWLLAAVSALSIFLLHGLINKKRLNTYSCEGRLENERKLQLCMSRIQNKVKSKHRDSPQIDVLIVPGNDAHSTMVNWKTIGITEGALQMEPRVLEALLAHEYGHIMNGSVILANVAIVNFLGFFFLLLINHFVFLAGIYLFVLLLFIIGVVRFNILSLFVSERLTTFIRRVCEVCLKSILGVCNLSARFSNKYGDYIADKYAVSLGYGLYLKRYLEVYSHETPDRRTISPLHNVDSDANKRIIKIQTHMRKMSSS